MTAIHYKTRSADLLRVFAEATAAAVLVAGRHRVAQTGISLTSAAIAGSQQPTPTRPTCVQPALASC